MTRAEKIKASAATHGTRGPSSKGEYSLKCPFCLDRVGKEDESFKLQCNPSAYNKKTGDYAALYHCYRCGTSGSCDLSWLGEVQPLPVDPNEIPEWSQPPESFEVLKEKSISLAPFVDYLKRRNVWEQAKHLGVGACTRGKYRGRVVVPMLDKPGGGWKGFSARLVKPGRTWPGLNGEQDAHMSPKYLYPKGMDRSGSLWGSAWVPNLKDRKHPLFLVEGVFDALPLYPYGLAAFGKNVTDKQLDLLAQLVGVEPWQQVEYGMGGVQRPVIVCLDGDAWEDAKVVCQRLRVRGVWADYCHLPPREDPGTLGWGVMQYIVGDDGFYRF